MRKISAVGLFCCDKFEETPKQKVINMSKLNKFHFNTKDFKLDEILKAKNRKPYLLYDLGIQSFISYLLHVRKIARQSVKKNRAAAPRIKAIQ